MLSYTCSGLPHLNSKWLPFYIYVHDYQKLLHSKLDHVTFHPYRALATSAILLIMFHKPQRSTNRGELSRLIWTFVKTVSHPCNCAYKFRMTYITMHKITAIVLQLALNHKTLWCKLHSRKGWRNATLIVSMAPAASLEYLRGPLLGRPYLSWQSLVVKHAPHIQNTSDSS